VDSQRTCSEPGVMGFIIAGLWLFLTLSCSSDRSQVDTEGAMEANVDRFVPGTGPSRPDLTVSPVIAEGSEPTPPTAGGSEGTDSTLPSVGSADGSDLGTGVTNAEQVTDIGDSTASDTGIPRFSTVFTIVLENRSFGSVIGNRNAPYLNGLAQQYALAENYWGTRHPSLPNYIVMVSGDTCGIADDHGPDVHMQTAPNLADQLERAGLTWRAYMESMDTPCQTHGTHLYAVRHDPFLYFRSVLENTSLCTERIVPFTEFAADLTGAPRKFMWITPNIQSDGHSASLAHADQWLSEVVPTILESAAWQDGGVLFITWDEGSRHDNRIPMIVVSPLVIPGARSQNRYDHRSYLATVEDGLGLPRLATTLDAPSMVDLFRATPGP
jgi:phosphatidylinositol-3-phosphatase